MAVGVINTFPPNTELPPGSTPAGPASLPGVTYTYAVTGLPQTWTGVQTFNAGSFTLGGSTSGSLTLNAPPIASGIITFPIGTTNFSITGGTSQVVKQTTPGGPFTVAQLTYSDIGQPTQQVQTAAGNVTVATTDGLIRINKSVGAATTVTLPLSSTKIGPVKIVDWKGDAGTNTITVNTTAPDTFQTGISSWPIGFNGGSLVFTPNADGSGYSV